MPPFPYSVISSSRDPTLPTSNPFFSGWTKANKGGQKGCLQRISRGNYAAAAALLLLATIVLGSLLSGANESNAVMRKGLHEMAIQLKNVDHLIATRHDDDSGRETALSDPPSSVRGIIRKQISTVGSLVTQHSELLNQSHNLQIQISKVRRRHKRNLDSIAQQGPHIQISHHIPSLSCSHITRLSASQRPDPQCSFRAGR
jgi:hypothetical protein